MRALAPPIPARAPAIREGNNMNTQHSAAVTALLAAAVVPVANAVIINVPGDQPTIQAGIDAAMNGDEIVSARFELTGPASHRRPAGRARWPGGSPG